ncbi:MAG: hypothetical protein VX407_04345 [Verrucomicrobiota bacterium]|nr:hypothetical protein [Verrucomicrobiota bacterium]
MENMSLLAIKSLVILLSITALTLTTKSEEVRQLTIHSQKITSGPMNHFFGYIGHVQNIPWSGDGKYILALRSSFQDRMPGPNDPADIVLIDTQQKYSVKKIDQTTAWNPQQGTMFYWNPKSPETQFFFNDRDTKTGKVFCVLFDITKGQRLKEYRYQDTPIGNSGVAQKGGHFLGINYARMARLRPVTGYKGTHDWTTGQKHPKDDGIFKVNTNDNTKSLLISFNDLAIKLKEKYKDNEIPSLFINHTLWNREDDRIFFFARGGWTGTGNGKKINQAFVMNSDGSKLKSLSKHIGGHQEWGYEGKMIGRIGKDQVIFDTNSQRVIDSIGTPSIFPDPEGDIALSPNGKWFVNGYKNKKKRKNYYVIYNLKDGSHVRSKGFDIGKWTSGDLRQDPSPCWNRDSNKILVPGLSDNGKSRQLHILDIKLN